MNRTSLLAFLIIFGGVAALLAGSAQSQVGPPKQVVALQPTNPGASQSGHINVSGLIRGSGFVGNGAQLTNIQLPLPYEASSAINTAEAALLRLVNSSTASQTYGIHGRTSGAGTGSAGVIGSTANSGSTAMGVVGSASGPNHIGVAGFATSSTGLAIGVYGHSVSTAGLAAFFDGNSLFKGFATVGPTLVTTIPNVSFVVGDPTGPAGSAKGMAVSASNTGRPGYSYALGTSAVAQHYLDGLTGRWHLENNGNTSITVDAAGNVGIGNPNPAADLDVLGGIGAELLRIRTGSGTKVQLSSSVDDVGLFETNGANGNLNVLASYLIGDLNHGYLSVSNPVGAATAGMYVSAAGQGIVFGNIKAFKVPHPVEEDKDIWYAAVEGPEAAMFVRGRGRLVGGVAKIEFPDHFAVMMASSESLTIQLTPRSAESQGLAVVSDSRTGFTVHELRKGRGAYEFDWEAKAVRAGHEDFRPVRNWDESISGQLSKQSQWIARQRTISLFPPK